MEKKDHEFCLRCGRKLKNPIAREKGYGSVCANKIRLEYDRRLFEIGDNLQSSQRKQDLQ